MSEEIRQTGRHGGGWARLTRLLMGKAMLLLSLSGCLGMPKTVAPVQDFELDRYLGTWYEIARLDHSFERGLQRVSASYSRHPEGGVRVVNRGYASADGQWREAEGRAWFVRDENTGYLKVSFFWPFYASYVVYELDEDYRYAWVSGADTSYLWFLSRTPQVDEDLLRRFVADARARGFAVDELILVEH